MKNLLHITQSDRLIGVSIITTSICFLISIILATVFWKNLPAFFSLYPKLPWGYARIGTKVELLYPLSIFLTSAIGNLCILEWVYQRANLLGRFLGITLTVLSVFFLIFTLQLMRII